MGKLDGNVRIEITGEKITIEVADGSLTAEEQVAVEGTRDDLQRASSDGYSPNLEEEELDNEYLDECGLRRETAPLPKTVSPDGYNPSGDEEAKDECNILD